MQEQPVSGLPSSPQVDQHCHAAHSRQGMARKGPRSNEARPRLSWARMSHTKSHRKLASEMREAQLKKEQREAPWFWGLEFHEWQGSDGPQYGQVASREAAKQAFRAEWDRRPKTSRNG